jgi:hypothetical protein
MLEGIIAREPVLTMALRESDFVEGPFAFEMQERDGRPHVEVRCGTFDPHVMSHEVQGRLKDKMIELVPPILARVFMLGDVEQVITKLFRDELALERAINFTSGFVTLGNVLGDSPKMTISAWHNPGDRDYPLARSEEWDASDRRAQVGSGAEKGLATPALAASGPPPKVRDMTRAKHTEIETISFIREVLWDQARWMGTAFGWDQNDVGPPLFALCFRNAEAAAKIFRLWREDLGPRDSEEKLRVTIIRGVSRKNPCAYRVVIGSNIEKSCLSPGTKQVGIIFRVNTMEPLSSQNLDRFLTQYRKQGRYKLTLATSANDPSAPTPFDASIEKQELHVRAAWEIGIQDVDGAGIREDDDPIIPAGKENAPVVELLHRRRGQ